MSNKEMEEFVELLYPFILKKLKEDGYFKNNTKIKNATVVSTQSANSENVDVKLPYDTTSFTVINKTGETLSKGDTICLFYWIDLKNAVALFKVKE